VAFLLPFETDLKKLESELASLDETDPKYADALGRLASREREIYESLCPVDTFLLSRNPLRPKTLDYVQHIFHDVRLLQNSDVLGDHLVVAGEGKIEVEGQTIDVIFVGQQTGPSSQWEDLAKLPPEEYRRWNQGMGYPDGYRKAVYAMDLAEERGWPVVVFVDTHGADPSEYSEEQGQAFAINEVIRKTTSLRTPSLSYIISLGASGGAIAFTPTNRTIMNQYATYMVISPGGCASILFRNREPEAIRSAARGLRLTAADALAQGTVDEVIEEGLHPGHRYPAELLAKAKQAVARNLAELLALHGEQAEDARREKFYAMGNWGESDSQRQTDTLAKWACEQRRAYALLRDALTDYFAERGAKNDRPTDEAGVRAQAEARQQVARMIYAAQRADAAYMGKVLGVDAYPLSKTQWAQIHEHLLERRYGHRNGSDALHPNGGVRAYRRLHPVCWVRELADEDSFREFPETIRYCSIDQLKFPGYEEALVRGTNETGLDTGLVTGAARIGGFDVVLAVNNFGLVGSSLCDEIGEKFRYAAGQALDARRPMISVAMGGGARMQEGTPSMHRNIPKIHHALNALQEAGLQHISVICDPTLGGTAISYGLRGDYMLVVEGSANIGFTGKRVVEQFRGRKVHSDFQHADWLLHRRFVDECVVTDDLRSRLAELLKHVAGGGDLADFQTRVARTWKPKEDVSLEDTEFESADAGHSLV
jgi:acetyl-CoA carboxylase carboxyl transferase alpha subunit